jgi:polyisoprenoid-binding protein YceI
MIKFFGIIIFIIGLVSITQSQVKNIPCIQDEISMTYFMVHPLHKIESTSKEVSSVVRIDPLNKTVQAVSATVDVTTFNSGNSNRDSHAMEVIDAISFPEASFTSSSVISRGDSLFATGNLTFHGITHEITINAIQQWTEKKLIIHGAFTIGLTNFKIERPSLLLVPVEDELRFTLTTAYAL